MGYVQHDTCSGFKFGVMTDDLVLKAENLLLGSGKA